MEIQQRYITTLFAVLIALLCLWIGVTGRLGSLLGACITPGYMTNGTTSGTALETSDPTAKSIPPGSQKPISLLQIASLAWNAGILSQQALAIATAIAQAESGGKTGAHNPGNGATDIEDSYGLWQINVLAHPQFDKKQLMMGSYNATAMYQISSSGTNWNPWGTYTSGAYKSFLGQAQSAAAQVIKANTGK